MSASHYDSRQKLYWDTICKEFKDKLGKKIKLGSTVTKECNL